MRSLRLKYKDSGRMLAIEAAERFMQGHVTAPRPALNEFMLHVARHLVKDGEEITNHNCASLALSEARVQGRSCRWRKDGLAPGIRKAYRCLTVRVPGFNQPIEFADWVHDRLYRTVQFAKPDKRAKRASGK